MAALAGVQPWRLLPLLVVVSSRFGAFCQASSLTSPFDLGCIFDGSQFAPHLVLLVSEAERDVGEPVMRFQAFRRLLDLMREHAYVPTRSGIKVRVVRPSL